MHEKNNIHFRRLVSSNSPFRYQSFKSRNTGNIYRVFLQIFNTLRTSLLQKLRKHRCSKFLPSPIQNHLLKQRSTPIIIPSIIFRNDTFTHKIPIPSTDQCRFQHCNGFGSLLQKKCPSNFRLFRSSYFRFPTKEGRLVLENLQRVRFDRWPYIGTKRIACARLTSNEITVHNRGETKCNGFESGPTILIHDNRRAFRANVRNSPRTGTRSERFIANSRNGTRSGHSFQLPRAAIVNPDGHSFTTNIRTSIKIPLHRVERCVSTFALSSITIVRFEAHVIAIPFFFFF